MDTLIVEENTDKVSSIASSSISSLKYGELSEEYILNKARRSLHEAEPIFYEFTTDEALLHQYFQLREDMFISIWGLKKISGVKEYFDRVSHIMVARRGRQCVGGGRLTISTPSSSQLMPMEKENFILRDLFPEYNLAERHYAEISRLAILPEYRSRVVFAEAGPRFIRRMIAEGVDYVFTIAPMSLASNYRQASQALGMDWKIRKDIKVPDREEYEGIHMVLSVIDMSRLTHNTSVSRSAAIPAPVMAD